MTTEAGSETEVKEKAEESAAETDQSEKASEEAPEVTAAEGEEKEKEKEKGIARYLPTWLKKQKSQVKPLHTPSILYYLSSKMYLIEDSMARDRSFSFSIRILKYFSCFCSAVSSPSLLDILKHKNNCQK